MGIEELIASYSVTVTGAAVILLFAISLVSLRIKRPTAGLKRLLFILIVATSVLPTIFLIVSTIYLNTISSSKGPVHWHADFEVWACGQELELRDPKGLSNKIGTAILHEHNDKRIHLEGVVVEPSDASLRKFFQVIGGLLTKYEVKVPTETGLRNYFSNSDSCNDGLNRDLQVFVYTTEGEYFKQTKLEDPASYIISHTANVPPGDCIIFEYDFPKDKTDKLCRSYKVAEKIGKIKRENP